MATKRTDPDRNCSGCEDRKENLDPAGCCTLALDSDELPARCAGNWTESKHYYVRRYCDIFTKAMSYHWDNLVYAELFAGPGRYRERPRGVFEDGSPLIALECGFTHYFLNDMADSCVDALQQRISTHPRGSSVEVEVFQQDAEAAAAPIADRIQALGRSTLAFALLDPPGIELSFNAIRTIANAGRVDLLINFPLGMNIKRQMWHRLEKESSSENHSVFDAYFGTTDWRRALSGTSRANAGAALASIYREQIGSLDYPFVRDAVSVTGRQNQRFYYLIYASKHERGQDFWSKVSKKQHDGRCV